jgi:hypothetical protein
LLSFTESCFANLITLAPVPCFPLLLLPYIQTDSLEKLQTPTVKHGSSCVHCLGRQDPNWIFLGVSGYMFSAD